MKHDKIIFYIFDNDVEWTWIIEFDIGSTRPGSNDSWVTINFSRFHCKVKKRLSKTYLHYFYETAFRHKEVIMSDRSINELLTMKNYKDFYSIAGIPSSDFEVFDIIGRYIV